MVWMFAVACHEIRNNTKITPIMRNPSPPPALKNIIRNVDLSVSLQNISIEIKPYSAALYGFLLLVQVECGGMLL